MLTAPTTPPTNPRSAEDRSRLAEGGHTGPCTLAQLLSSARPLEHDSSAAAAAAAALPHPASLRHRGRGRGLGDMRRSPGKERGGVLVSRGGAVAVRPGDRYLVEIGGDGGWGGACGGGRCEGPHGSKGRRRLHVGGAGETAGR